MRTWSLRGWVLLISFAFAIIVAGGVSLTTYVIVTDAMQVVAYDTAERMARAAEPVLEEAARIARAEAAGAGEQEGCAARGVRDRFIHELSGRLGMDIHGTQYALYDAADTPLWSSSQRALSDQEAPLRREALQTGSITHSVQRRGSLITGLITQAQLSTVVAHLPISLPDGTRGVLDIVYSPSVEERMIDAIRLPMTLLAITTMVVMIVLVQTSMGWVLDLVDELRRAADSIDAGRLDERLPSMGNNEIGELARSINRLIERLARRAEAQARFVADASHELATPVAGIRGYTNILRAWGAEDPKVREEAIDAIDRESRRMARLTSDLLNLLHADQGLRLRSERFDLNELVRQRLAVLASTYVEKGVEFIGPEEGPLVMVGDPDRVEDVLSILIDNAGKYTPPGGTVRVDTARRRDEVIITVADTGVGIPESDLPHIFDRFFRSERARAEGEGGFGLGLAIAKSIVDNMNGTISVASQPHVGTTFTVTLPRGRT